MLQLVCYDLQKPVKSFEALADGIRRCGGGINFLNGPRIYGGSHTPQKLLNAIKSSLEEAAESQGQAFNDKLLVFPVVTGEIGTGRRDDILTLREVGSYLKARAATPAGLDAREREILAAAAETLEGLSLPRPHVEPVRSESKVLAIAFALRNPWGRFQVLESDQKKHREAVNRAIEAFPDHCRPLGTVWFVQSRKSAHDVHLEIEKNAPMASKDELLVVEVKCDGQGRCVNLDPASEQWLKTKGVVRAPAARRLAS